MVRIFNSNKQNASNCGSNKINTRVSGIARKLTFNLTFGAFGSCTPGHAIGRFFEYNWKSISIMHPCHKKVFVILHSGWFSWAPYYPVLCRIKHRYTTKFGYFRYIFALQTSGWDFYLCDGRVRFAGVSMTLSECGVVGWRVGFNQSPEFKSIRFSKSTSKWLPIWYGISGYQRQKKVTLLNKIKMHLFVAHMKSKTHNTALQCLWLCFQRIKLNITK
jgi:hypothetical protein